MAVGRESGVKHERELTGLFRIRDGRITSERIYLDRGEALEAAGLRKYAMSQENVEVVRRAFDV